MIARSVITESGCQTGDLPVIADQLTKGKFLFPGPRYSTSNPSKAKGGLGIIPLKLTTMVTGHYTKVSYYSKAAEGG